MDHKSNLSKFKKIEIILSIFSDYNTMRLGINYKEKKNSKKHKHMEFKQHLFLNNKQVTEEIKKEIKKCIETNDNENTTQNLWYAAKAILRGKFIAIQSYLKKQEKHLIDNLTLHLKQLEKEEQENPTISRRKEIKRSKQK